MWALVEDNNVTQVFARPKAITIGDNQYPSNIMSVWSAEDLEAIGIYEVVIDNTNLKDKEYYINTNQSFDFANGTVTASYGTATAKALDDVTDDDGNVTRGLKYNHKQIINQQAGDILSQTDWYIIRKTDAGTAIPSNIQTWRNAIRADATRIETAITNAADMNAFIALHTDTYKADGTVDQIATVNSWTELGS